MNYFNAYAATSAKAPLKPFSFDPGELGPEEVEIKVSHCGVCHSDLSMLDNEWGLSKYPFVPGHEVVGTVVALGEEAEMFPMSEVNDAIEHLGAGKARYRIVLENDLA
jgi:uncharacterized zinc-type alcohol dehydrogenase-like protein